MANSELFASQIPLSVLNFCVFRDCKKIAKFQDPRVKIPAKFKQAKFRKFKLQIIK